MIDPAVVHISTLLVTFGIFVGILVWAFSRKRSKAFEEAAQLPFQEDDEPARHASTHAR